MKYLVDADWVISFLNGKRNAVDLVGELADEGIALSIITCGEVYEGLFSTSSSEDHLARFEDLLGAVDIVSPDILVAHRYATMRSQLRTQGLLIPDNDLWIAATAAARDLTLVSRDHHFSRLTGLKLYPVA